MKDFRAFITRGNVVDMAVGIIIGAAFGAIISSLVRDIIMPPVGLALGNVDFTNLFVVLKPMGAAYPSLADAQAAGAVSINYGVFINTIIAFLVIALIVFFLVVRPIARMTAKKPAPAGPPTTKDCPYCKTSINIAATRCPNCTSQLER